MDGVHPPRCVEWRWCVLLLSRPVQWCGSCPTHPTAVLASTAVMSCTVPRQVCGVWCGCVSVLFVWWGILCPLPPSSWWRVGPSWMVGWRSGWWVAWWVKGGCVAGLPVCVLASPLVVYPVALLNGGSGVCRVVPVFGLGTTLHVVLTLLALPLLSSSPPPPLCSLSQRCWFRVVSLRQGCVIAK